MSFGFITTFINKVKDIFHLAGEVAAQFIAPLAKSIAENGGQVLVTAALHAVLEAERTNGDGSAKFAAAKKVVIAELVANGIPVIENAINGALESAVAYMNAHKINTVAASQIPTLAEESVA